MGRLRARLGVRVLVEGAVDDGMRRLWLYFSLRSGAGGLGVGVVDDWRRGLRGHGGGGGAARNASTRIAIASAGLAGRRSASPAPQPLLVTAHGPPVPSPIAAASGCIDHVPADAAPRTSYDCGHQPHPGPLPALLLCRPPSPTGSAPPAAVHVGLLVGRSAPRPGPAGAGLPRTPMP